MNKIGFVRVLVLALSLSVMAAIPAAAETGKLSFNVSGLFMTRSAGATYPLISSWTHPGQGDILTTDEVALNSWKLGIDASLGIVWGRLGVEIRAFTLGKWTNSAENMATTGTVYAIETSTQTHYGMPAGATLTADNEGSLREFEANLTYDLSPAFRLYGGVRYLILDETLRMHGDFPGGGFEDDVWNTENRMIGGQVGLRVDIPPPIDAASPGFILGGHCAFGLFSNSAHVDFAVLDSPYISDMDDSKVSLAVDAGLRFGYRLSGSFELYAGYNLLWLNSAALAANQVRGTTSYNSPPISTLIYSSLFAHGAKVGFAVHL